MVWNIERGFELDRVVERIGDVDPDVVLLQEVDVGARRSGYVDTAAEIGTRLGYRVVYANEEDSVNPAESARREPRDVSRTDGGRGGSAGNAILTRLPLLGCWTVPLECVRVPQRTYHAHKKIHCATAAALRLGPRDVLACYSVHLDAFSGRLDRVRQFVRVNADAAAVTSRGRGCIKHLSGVTARDTVHAVVGGDLNTHSHGVVRLLKSYVGDDPYRFEALGMSESAWWQQVVLGTAAPDDTGAAVANAAAPACRVLSSRLVSRQAQVDRRRRTATGVPPPLPSDSGWLCDTAPSTGGATVGGRERRLAFRAISAEDFLDLNPAQLQDPFPKDGAASITQRIGPIFSGKLDWLLVTPGLTVSDLTISRMLGASLFDLLLSNGDDAPASDHEYVVARLAVTAAQ